MTTSEEYLTPPEAAKMLRVQVTKIRRWIESGELKAVDISEHRLHRPRWRIARTDWDEFLGRRSARPVAATVTRRRPVAADGGGDYY